MLLLRVWFSLSRDGWTIVRAPDRNTLHESFFHSLLSLVRLTAPFRVRLVLYKNSFIHCLLGCALGLVSMILPCAKSVDKPIDRLTCPNHCSFRLRTVSRHLWSGPTKSVFFLRTEICDLCHKIWIKHLWPKLQSGIFRYWITPIPTWPSFTVCWTDVQCLESQITTLTS